MKKTILLFLLTITLQSGVIHTYENAEVKESPMYESNYAHGFTVRDKECFKGFCRESTSESSYRDMKWKQTGWNMHEETTYITVHDLENPNTLLGIYEKKDIRSIE